MAQGVRRLLFDPVGARLIPSRGGRSVPSTVCPSVDNPRGGKSGGWTIGEWTIWKVDNPGWLTEKICEFCAVTLNFLAFSGIKSNACYTFQLLELGRFAFLCIFVEFTSESPTLNG